MLFVDVCRTCMSGKCVCSVRIDVSLRWSVCLRQNFHWSFFLRNCVRQIRNAQVGSDGILPGVHTTLFSKWLKYVVADYDNRFSKLCLFLWVYTKKKKEIKLKICWEHYKYSLKIATLSVFLKLNSAARQSCLAVKCTLCIAVKHTYCARSCLNWKCSTDIGPRVCT